ncbi:MAG: DUF2017 family protein [Terrimicrobiaceae bacterium]|nr:DUF2017 family protein [Terrimicrobiaceae bacterium]
MEIEVLNDGTTEFRQVPDFLLEMLKEVPALAASDDPRVEARFFPSPVAADARDVLSEDWSAYVQPELQASFLEARETIQADLRSARKDGALWTIRIPLNHADAWLHALNQARLAIAAANDFGEDDLSADLPAQVSSEREQALLRMHFYGMVQEWFVRFLD